MTPGVKNFARPRSLGSYAHQGSYANPCTLSSEEDSDELEGDEDYTEPGRRRRSRPRKSGQSSTASVRSSHKRKKSMQEAEILAEPMTPDHYRQPICAMIPNIKQDVTWKEGYEKVSNVLRDRRLRGAAAQREKEVQRLLLDEDVQWGSVFKGRGKQADERCQSCIAERKTCIVHLNLGESEGGPYRIISSCIRCLVSHTPCDLLLPRINSTVNEPHPPAVKPPPVYVPPLVKAVAIEDPPSQDNSSKKTANKSTRKSNTVNKEEVTKSVPGVAPSKKEKPNPDDKTVVEEKEADQGAGNGDIVAAARDLAEFVNHMRAKATPDGGVMDLGTRGMFQLADQQIAVLQKYAKQKS